MSSFLNKIPDLIGIILGLFVFGLWMSIVGNPHVVETVIGLVIGLVIWFVVRRMLKKLVTPRK